MKTAEIISPVRNATTSPTCKTGSSSKLVHPDAPPSAALTQAETSEQKIQRLEFASGKVDADRRRLAADLRELHAAQQQSSPGRAAHVEPGRAALKNAVEQDRLVLDADRADLDAEWTQQTLQLPAPALSPVDADRAKLLPSAAYMDANGHGVAAGPATAAVAPLVPEMLRTLVNQGQAQPPGPIAATTLPHLSGTPAAVAQAQANDLIATAQAQTVMLRSAVDLQIAPDRIKEIQGAVSHELRENQVFKALIQSATASAGRAQSAVSARAELPQTLQGPPAQLAEPPSVSEWDFKAFAQIVRTTLTQPDLAVAGDLPGAGHPVAPAPNAGAPTFRTAFVAYFSAFYQGKYYDRFGNNLAKPALSRNITNTEISGAVQVMWEVIMDYALRTPVWIDTKAKKYYPGASSNAPTVVAANLVTPLALLDETDSENCGITATKAEAIEYLSNAAAAKASGLGGMVGGSFGGLHFGFGILGKFSIGDNQTIQSVVQTSLSKTAERAAEEASYRALYWVGYPQGTVAVNLIQQYLDDKSTGH